MLSEGRGRAFEAATTGKRHSSITERRSPNRHTTLTAVSHHAPSVDHMTLTRLLTSAATWHVTSQHQARRNALVASTAMTKQRRERDEVEEFLAAHAARFDRANVVSVSVHRQQRASRSA